MDELLQVLTGKRILITGGTGTLGKAVIKRLGSIPRSIVVFSRDETKQGLLRSINPDLEFVLGDVAKYKDIYRALHGVDIVFHFAAYKVVPSAQNNIPATIETNVIGSQNVVDASVERGVTHVVASSTDKSCLPSNAYGASKYLMECIFQHGNKLGDTKFTLARYGNVIGSNASVIPLFMRQRELGYVTLTHADMTRFWITVDQAVDLILAALINPPGTILVPKAPAMSMKRVAEIVAGKDAEIRITGIRAGEKIHESMVSEAESFHTEILENHFLIHPPTGTYHNPKAPFTYDSNHAPELNPQVLLDEMEKLS
jgi:UDP-N-acetylglucosamine 4,6-dehydratase